MLIVFIIVSVLAGMFMAYIWSSSGLANVILKMLFSAYTIWAVLMLLAQLTPLINNGTLRLI